MDRAKYNECMRPYLTGSKPKEQRKSDFCIGAKICSGKAQTREQAAQLCSKTAPKQPQQSPSPQINPCVSVIDMATWVQQPNGDGPCRPCLLAPLTQWYMDVLRTGGRDDLAAALEGAVDGGEVVLATKLDEVKGEVSPELRARLKEFDCHAQLYKEGEDDN
jgi:G3E family GTPase